MGLLSPVQEDQSLYPLPMTGFSISQRINLVNSKAIRKAISGMVTRKRFLLGASEPQCKRDLYSNLISFRFCVVVLISFRFCVVIYHLSLFIWGRPNKGQRIL